MPPGFHLLIAAQFASALADNALLIVTIALLHERDLPPALAPLLKFAFTIAYVVLAPFVGPVSDAMPKARLMAWMNGMKALGALALLAGVQPLAGFLLVGIGAAAFAPAKYGLITEMVAPRQLVAANGWIEVSVVGAVLLGTVLGGGLVSTAWLESALVQALREASGAAALSVSLVAVLAIYLVAGLLNLGVPDSGARYPRAGRHPGRLAREFWRDSATLWRDPHGGGSSLAATTLFWGIGATLQFIVLRWAHEALGLPLSQAAMLQGVVAVGVVIGATLAGRYVRLDEAPRMLWFGVPLGLALPLLGLLDGLALAIPLLIGAGAVGGLMVVPLNALLQHRGCQLLSAGRSIAVQGCSENAGVLAMLGAYAALVAAELPLASVMTGFGFAIAGAITSLALRERRRAPAGRAGRPPVPAPTRSGR